MPFNLHEACRQGKLKKVQNIIVDETEHLSSIINARAGIFGYTPLHEATSSRKHKIVTLLLNNGAAVDATSNGNYTPLHIAASIGDVSCAKVLLQHDASVDMIDEYRKTPYRTAMLNRNFDVARLLKTAEVKNAVLTNSSDLRNMIEELNCGDHVTDNCFEECLQLAVTRNNHLSAGFIILRAPNNMLECFRLAMASRDFKTIEVAAMLLLCMAAKHGETEVLHALCQPEYKWQQDERNYDLFFERYTQTRVVYPEVLKQLREAVQKIDHAFPVSLACNKEHYAAAKILLFNIYCSEEKLEADWHGLALSALDDSWIDDIAKYRKIYLGWNSLKRLPNNMGNLRKVVKLDLKKNSLRTVPSCLFKLPMLRNLNLSGNKIEKLPEVDQWAPFLNILELNDNLLFTFPGNLTGLAIEFLNLANNRLVKLPMAICEITSLTHLDISYNSEIHELPLEVGKLTKLSQFNMKGLQINDIPAHLQKSTKNLIQHLRAKLRFAQPYYVMKLMLIGKANQGKTTLMHRLKGDENFNVNYATQGIDIQDMELKKGIFGASPFTFRVWDFAGQEDYYATHQCFLSARALYLLIWDITKGDQGVKELKPWLDNIAMRVPKASIIIVATKLDKLDGDWTKDHEKMKEKIKKLLRSKSIYSKLNIDPDNHIVSVTSITKHCSYRQLLENLKVLIYNVAEEMTYNGTVEGVKVMGEKIPLSYRNLVDCMDKLQKEKLQNNEIPIITREEFLTVARSMVSDKDTLKDEDIEPAVAFLHNIGSILHYNDPNQGLKDLFFISPSWLCKLMAKIITVKAANNFFKNGILQTNRIQFIIGNQELFPPKFYERYMRLLYRFQIACKVDDHRILVPSKLSERSDLDIKEVDDRCLLSRYHFFTCIPYGFWSRFMSRILLLMQEMLGSPYVDGRTSKTVNDDGLDEEDAKKDALVPDEVSLSSEVASIYDVPIIINSTENRQPGLVYVNTLQRKTFSQTSPTNESQHSDCGTPDSAIISTHYSKFGSASTPSCGSESSVERFDETVDYNDNGNSFNPLLPSDNVDENESPRRCNDYLNKTNDVASEAVGHDVTDDLPTAKQQDDNDASLDDNDSITKSENQVEPISNHVDGEVNNNHIILCDPSNEPTINHDNMAGLHNPYMCKDGTVERDVVFNDCTDLAYLLDKGYLKCWKGGLVFNHPLLYFSVKEIKSVIPNRQAIETKVSDKPLGYRVLGFIVQHIRTLVKEWYTGFSGDDGESPYIMQRVACPICKRLGREEPYLFDIEEAFASVYQKDNSDYCLQCMHNHTPQVVDIKDLCPDLLFSDLSSSLQVDANDLSYEDSEDFLLGVGAFGRVYSGTYKTMQAAIKQYYFDEQSLTTGLDIFYDIRQEVYILSKLRSHPFIVEYLGFATHPRVCAVMELASHGTLKRAIHDGNTQMKRLVFFRILIQLTSALKFMHSRNIVHRDIKPDNILLFSLDLEADINVKLNDFGTANFMSPTGMKDPIGTPGYMAPEMFDYLSHDEYSCSVDVYSVGITTCELITRRRPFHNLAHRHEVTQALKDGDRPIYGDIPRSIFGLITLTDLTTKLWHQEPIKRPTADHASDVLSDLAFQLLYGKTALEKPQNPRQMCFLVAMNEVWILCDDKKGAWLTILDTQTSLVKQILTIDGELYGLKHFNLVNICAIDDHNVAIVLRGEHDVMLTFTAEQRKIQNHHQFGELHVRSLIANSKYVFIGYQHGSVERFLKKNFLKNKKKDPFRLNVKKNCHIQSMLANDTYFIACCNNTLYQYNAELKCLNWTTPLEHPLREMISLQDESKILVSFQCSPQICFYDLKTFESKLFSCEAILKEKEPAADQTDTRVTCMCQMKDVLWIGTGSGHVLIYQLESSSLELTFLHSFQPYSIEIRSFCVVPVKESDGSGVDCLVVTSGKLVNEFAFGKDSICRLNFEFPVDKVYIDRVFRKTGTWTFPSIDSKLVMFWQLLSAAEMKCITNNSA